MKLDIDSVAMSFPCPKCSESCSENVGRLKGDPEITCAACGTSFGIDADGLRRGIADAEKQLADFGRDIGKLFGKK